MKSIDRLSVYAKEDCDEIAILEGPGAVLQAVLTCPDCLEIVRKSYVISMDLSG